MEAAVDRRFDAVSVNRAAVDIENCRNRSACI
jgi:hypothetical protein